MKRGREDHGDGRHSQLDEETLRYYEEVGAHFKTLDDDEEKQILADNVLSETEGKEADVVPDAACSRVIESFIPYASITAIDKFTRGCLQDDNLGLICTSGPFGSHVMEKLLTTIATAALHASDDTHAVLEGCLSSFTTTASVNLYDMITSKYGSFVGRRLLCVLCGKDVSSPPIRKPGLTAAAPSSTPPPSTTPPPTTVNHTTNQQQGGLMKRVSMATAVDHSSGNNNYNNHHTSNSYPHIFQQVIATILSDDWTGPELTAIQCDPYAGPFLQSLLRASVVMADEQQTGRLVIHLLGGNAASGPDTVTSDAMYRLLTDRHGSHLMEAAFEAAPDDVLQKMLTAAFKGRLLNLAQHPSANFAVQAALAAVRRPQQLKRMFEDLRPHLATLLRARRGGVVAVLLAAAGRVGSLESDCADALWHSADTGLDTSMGVSPLHKLLTLDTTTKLGQSGSGIRLSPLGCAALVTVLQYPSAACKKWADALGELTSVEVGTVVRDPGGCRVIETYLEGVGGAPKRRRKLLSALKGSWAGAASTVAGCYFVEKCYNVAEVDEREVITGELAAAEDRIGVSSRGSMLLQKCHVDAFKKSGGGGANGEWQKRVNAAGEVKREFAELFGGGGDEEVDVEEEVVPKKKKMKKSKEKKSSNGAVDGEEGEEKKKEKKAKKKKKDKKDKK